MATKQTTTENLTLIRATESFYLDRDAAYCTPPTLRWYRKLWARWWTGSTRRGWSWSAM